MRWVVSILARRYDASERSLVTDHLPTVVEAANRYEAKGKATAVALIIYPSSEGWAERDVAVDDAAKVVDPETVVPGRVYGL